MEKTRWVPLASRVLAVAVWDGYGEWSAFIDAVPGKNHEDEYVAVLERGKRTTRAIASAIFPDVAANYHYRD